MPDFDPQVRPLRERFLTMNSTTHSERTRGTLQIQDGCDEHCTYCIIPTVRGPSVSRPMEEILQQALQMVDGGYRELALTGVHSGSYGQDGGDGASLVTLLEQLDQINGLERVRLNSVEPACVTDELIDFASSSTTKLCRHFHVPMQSGDDQVLKRMGRRYHSAFYAERLHRLAAAVPDCALGADIMVGFPGEDEALFQNTLAFTTALPLTYLHVFSYSPRDETPALKLGAHADRAQQRTRAARLIELSQHKRLAFHGRFVGSRVSVLTEEVEGREGTGLASGLTDNYMKVRFPPPDGLCPNDTVEITVTQAREDIAYGEASDGQR
jgi:threonylcarbamoyladenosine tRNA methylthiotransferase MtaB